MRALVSSDAFDVKLESIHLYLFCYFEQAVLSVLVAAAVAAPQYGGAPTRQQAAPAITKEQWASLNPYGSASSYPAEEKATIEEIQRQWERFLEYLPWLKV